MIQNKSSFTKGALLLISFAAVFFLIMSPVFKDDAGKAQNGLEFADDLFNKLSKGSSYFIPEVQKGVSSVAGKNVNVTFTLKQPEKAAAVVKVLSDAGATVTAEGATIKVDGDLSKILEAAVKASDALYHNDAAAVTAQYGMDGLQAAAALWDGLAGMIKPLQREKQIKEAQVVDLVMKKAIEPGYNFYGIPAAKVSDKLGVMTALLVFYVIYTMWYGFAIFELFEGIGLTMKKSKVKQEA